LGVKILLLVSFFLEHNWLHVQQSTGFFSLLSFQLYSWVPNLIIFLLFGDIVLQHVLELEERIRNRLINEIFNFGLQVSVELVSKHSCSAACSAGLTLLVFLCPLALVAHD